MLRLREDIPLFPQGRKKAFTLSSDDGVTQDERLIALMKEYGLKGTFCLNSGLMGDRDWLIQPGIDASHYKYEAEKITEIYNGFEIAVHTMTHAELTRIPTAAAAWEIAENKRHLESLVKHPVQGMSYPFGTYNTAVENTAEMCGIAYSRTVHTTNGFALPENFLRWNPTCHYCDPGRTELALRFLKPVTAEEYKEPLLYYVWGHAYELDAYQDWAALEEFFQLIGRHEEIWYAENMEICSYMKAVQRLIYSSCGTYITNPSSLDVWLQIDGKAYQIPSGKTISVNWQHQDDSHTI